MISQACIRSSIVLLGEWRSLVSAPALGAGGRRFESALPDRHLLGISAIRLKNSGLCVIVRELNRERASSSADRAAAF